MWWLKKVLGAASAAPFLSCHPERSEGSRIVRADSSSAAPPQNDIKGKRKQNGSLCRRAIDNRPYNYIDTVDKNPIAKGREAAFIRRAKNLYAKALRQTMADEASTAKGEAATYRRAKSQLDADLRNGLISDEEYDAALNDVMRHGQWEELDRPMSEAEFEAQMEKEGEKQGQYSIKKTSKMDYSEQLSQIENKSMNGSNSLYIGRPSETLQKAGFSEYPFAMNQGDYRKSRRSTANNENYSAHAVPFDFFENMPQYIAGAPMLIDNGKKASVVTTYGPYLLGKLTNRCPAVGVSPQPVGN